MNMQAAAVVAGFCISIGVDSCIRCKQKTFLAGCNCNTPFATNAVVFGRNNQS